MTALARIERRGEELFVFTPYDPVVVAQFKALPGTCWDAKEHAWHGPEEVISIALETLTAVGVLIADDIPAATPGPRWLFPPVVGLRTYQNEGVQWLLDALRARGSALLADDMGLGKTLQAVKVIQALYELGEASRALVLCPAVMVKKWQRELEQWGQLKSVVLGKTLGKKKGGGRLLTWEPGTVAVCSFDTFRGLKGVALADIIVPDEVHYLAGAKTLRSKATRAYLTACRKAGPCFTLALSGTPMTARPRDLWHPLELLFPGRFGFEWAFQNRYCDGRYEEIPGLERKVWVADGASNLDELGKRLSRLMLRRVKSEVEGLPARQRIMIPVELGEKARKGLARASQALALSGEHVGSLLSTCEEHKLDAAIELANDCLAQGRRPLLFTLRKETARRLGEALNAPVVTGEDAPGRREELLRGARAGVATVYSMTTGLDLVQFDTVIFVGLDWVPSTLLQAENRIHRIGQERDVLFYYLIGLGTVDEAVQACVIERLDNFSTVVGGGEEGGLATTLRGQKTQDELIAEIIASVMKGELV